VGRERSSASARQEIAGGERSRAAPPRWRRTGLRLWRKNGMSGECFIPHLRAENPPPLSPLARWQKEQARCRRWPTEKVKRIGRVARPHGSPAEEEPGGAARPASPRRPPCHARTGGGGSSTGHGGDVGTEKMRFAIACRRL
jgi:hypothetical protein